MSMPTKMLTRQTELLKNRTFSQGTPGHINRLDAMKKPVDDFYNH